MISQTFENMTIPITEFKKHLGKVIKELTSPKILLKNNKPEAVIIPFEQFKIMEMVIEKQMDFELANEMNKRLNDSEAKYIDNDKVFEELGI